MTPLHQGEAMLTSALIGIVASLGVSDNVTIAAIAAIAPTLTGIALIIQNRRNTAALVSGQLVTQGAVHEVHQIADGRLTEALNAISALKDEVSRLNQGGSPTPAASNGSTVTQTTDGTTEVKAATPPGPFTGEKK